MVEKETHLPPGINDEIDFESNNSIEFENINYNLDDLENRNNNLIEENNKVEIKEKKSKYFYIENEEYKSSTKSCPDGYARFIIENKYIVCYTYFINNKINGWANIVYPTKSVIVEIENGYWNGYGEIYSNNVKRYGIFNKDFTEISVFPTDVNYFTGYSKKGKREFGKLIYNKTGNSYKGEFKGNKLNFVSK